MAKSWSETKKILEKEMLCEELRGRVTYFFTLFRKSHDQAGLFQVKVDGEVWFQATPFNEKHFDGAVLELAKEHNAAPMASWEEYATAPMASWEEYDKTYEALEAQAEQRVADEGHVDSYYMRDYIHKYLNQSIGESLQDENPVIRMFAILDKRVGKRTLQKIHQSGALEQQPAWLQRFYQLRELEKGVIR